MKKRLCGVLVATQSLGTWFAVAQTTTPTTPRQQLSAIQVNTTPAAPVSTGRTNPAIAVSHRILDFPSVAVDRASKLSFRVQNVGGGILSGAAHASPPFTIVSGSPYVLRNSQSQVITVQYVPTAIGMNITVIRLTGGGGASITVAGSAVPTAPAAPASPPAPARPLNLRLVAGR